MMDRIPDFFIIGAPKCGTTALSYYLSEHPEIFFSTPKEPGFFCKDVKTSHICTMENYLSLFIDAKPNHRRIGEGSVWNLYSESAIRDIYEFNPYSKIIIMLRKPIDLLYSLFYQSLADGTENAESFAQAWQWQDQRLTGHKLIKYKDIKLTQYRDIGKLGRQLERVLKIFDASQIKVIFYEDFKLFTPIIYKETVEFLGLKPDNRRDFPIINRRKRVFSRKLQKVLLTIERAPISCTFRNIIKYKLNVRNFSPIQKIKKLNTTNSGGKKTINQEFAKSINSYFKKDITLLSSLTHRPLDQWLE